MNIAPMLATQGCVAGLKAQSWAFEGKWDGYRVMLEVQNGSVKLTSRNGGDVTADFPQLQRIGARFLDQHIVFDGEAVAVGRNGVPSFSGLQARDGATHVEFWAFDLVSLDDRPLHYVTYQDRRKLLSLLGTLSDGELVVPAQLDGDGAQALAAARERGLEGVVAKDLKSIYRSGRSPRWIKEKFWHDQEVVIGGWRKGDRTSGIGSLLTGIPSRAGLRFTGRVGTGFTEKFLDKLKPLLLQLQTTESPFDAPLAADDAAGVKFVDPQLVAEVRYSNWTAAGKFERPTWRGLRPDKEPNQVVKEI